MCKYKQMKMMRLNIYFLIKFKSILLTNDLSYLWLSLSLSVDKSN